MAAELIRVSWRAPYRLVDATTVIRLVGSDHRVLAGWRRQLAAEPTIADIIAPELGKNESSSDCLKYDHGLCMNF